MFQIQTSELEFGSRIDIAEKGTFGEVCHILIKKASKCPYHLLQVWQARYHDRAVAVKKLKVRARVYRIAMILQRTLSWTSV